MKRVNHWFSINIQLNKNYVDLPHTKSDHECNYCMHNIEYNLHCPSYTSHCLHVTVVKMHYGPSTLHTHVLTNENIDSDLSHFTGKSICTGKYIAYLAALETDYVYSIT